MDDVVGDRVGALCDELSRWPELAAVIRDGGAQPELDELLLLLAGRADPDQRRVAELLDAIQEACTRQGLPGLTRRIPSLPWGIHDTTGTGIAGWTCPLGRCARVVLPEAALPTPTCAAAHNEMKPYSPDLR